MLHKLPVYDTLTDETFAAYEVVNHAPQGDVLDDESPMALQAAVAAFLLEHTSD